MKRLLVGIAIISIVGSSTLAWAQLLPRFNPGDVLHAVDLNAVVNQINAMGSPSPQPQTINVDCSTGGTIGAALQQANPGDIILVTGTCNESVLIIKDGITLDGQGPTIVNSGSPTQSTITVDGAQRVTIQGLTAQNGDRGIHIVRGAAAILVNVTATGNTREGIRVVHNAAAQFQGAIISHNNGGDDGILIASGGSGIFAGATVQLFGNGDAGLNFGINGHGGSSPESNNTFDIHTNTNDGMRVAIGSAFRLENATIMLHQNGARGLNMFRGGAVDFRTSTLTVTNNTTDGIGVFNSSSFIIQNVPVATPISISGHSDRGMEVANTSSLIIQNSRLNITGNTGDGVGVFGSSRFSIEQSSTVLSSMNTLHGMNLGDASSINITNDTTLTLQNNSRAGLNLQRASGAFLRGTTTTSNNGEIGIVLGSTCSADVAGTTLVQDNIGTGINLNRASTLLAAGSFSVLSNGDSGIVVNDASSLRLFDGTMVIDGNTNSGISVVRHSEARLEVSATTFALQIRNNTTQGIQVNEHSTLRVGTGAVLNNNGDDGLQARRSSEILALGVSITGNGGNGLDVDESSAEVNGSNFSGTGTPTNITGNSQTDINATFGSRLTLNNSTIGAVACDSTVLHRGNTPRRTGCP